MFIALLTQFGEGCDYSIACGNDWVKLEAKNQSEALEELQTVIIGKRNDGYEIGYEDGYWNERSLRFVTLLEVSSTTEIPINTWYEKATSIVKESTLKAFELEERKLYARLKEKFK